MKGDYTRRIAEYRRLQKEEKFDEVHEFFEKNPDLEGCIDELNEASLISVHGNIRNYFDKVREYTQKKLNNFIELEKLRIPNKVISSVMFRSPDFVDLNPENIANSYFYLLNKGLTKTAAATIASIDYLGREKNSLGVIADNYHIIKEAYGTTKFTQIDPFKIVRYKKLYIYPESRLALLSIEDFEERFLDFGLDERLE